MPFLKSRPTTGHAAGIYSDMTLDGPDIGTLVVVVDRAKNLPNRRTMGKQDPYCAMRLAKEAKKTETDRRGGQTPRWDQELRFDVHDSPDYYKLKCSIFNDDKKTDLIGEAWIDLTDVIKLGGGQKDLWHQLNFKGKYAGDLRIELTFYDTREQPQDFRKSRQSKAQNIDGSSESGADSVFDAMPSSGRSLGPRDIKRRPLPESPLATTPVQQSPTKATRAIPEVSAPPRIPAKIPHQPMPQSEVGNVIHAPIAKRVRRGSHQPQSEPEQALDDLVDSIPSYPIEDQSPYGRYVDDNAISNLEQVKPWQHEALTMQHQHTQHPGMQYDDQHQPRNHQRGTSLGQPPHTQQYVPDTYQRYIEDEPLSMVDDYGYPEMSMVQRPPTQHMHSDPGTMTHELALDRPHPNSAHSEGQLVRYQAATPQDMNQQDPVYQQSALHQSRSHHDFIGQSDAPPPLPPKHRDTPPRRQRSEFPPSSFAGVPQPLRVGAKRASVAERSPLQAFEDEYLPPQEFDTSSKALHLPEQRRSTNGMDHYVMRSSDNLRNLERRSMQEIANPLHQQRPSSNSRRSSYEIRNTKFTTPEIYAEPDNFLHEQGHPRSRHSNEPSHQPFVEDAPPSPGLPPMVARKAVGASPKKLNGVPFGPDAYDVLNPSSSPVTNDRTIFQTPEQAKEAQRLHEAAQVKNLGPIIGNDGREIDPSDHLPSDTWAPEPDRKQRQPEHVIHIRTKSDRPAGARTSPVVIRHNRNNQPAQSQPNSPFSTTSSQPANSPAVRPSPQNFIGGPNRLQKAMPANARADPIYSSPAAGAASTPNFVLPSHNTDFGVQANYRPAQHQRQPSYDHRIPSHIARPPLAEYQIPVGSSNTPRSAGYDAGSSARRQKANGYGSYDDTPTKPATNRYSSQIMPNVDLHRGQVYEPHGPFDSRDRRGSYDQRSDYSFENHPEDAPAPTMQQPVQQHYDDPLAAEMSLIDIGPSRSNYDQSSMSRSLVRRW